MAQAKVDEVTKWLSQLNLSKYEESLRNEGLLKLSDLADLKDDEIQTLAADAGLNKIHQNKFFKAAKEAQSTFGDAVAVFLKTYKLQKYTSSLKENGLESLADLKGLSESDINELASEAGLGVIHKKHFLKAVQEYTSGAYQGGGAAADDDEKSSGNVAVNVTCYTCKGKKFAHYNGGNKHNKGADQRCYACKECAGCNGNGIVQGQSQVCPKCTGRGWFHDNGGNKHNREENEPCYACKECKGCQGLGHLKGDKRIRICPQCKSKGWSHQNGGNKHNREMNQKCYACSTCVGCDGNGYLELDGVRKIVVCPKCKSKGFAHDNGGNKHNREKNQKCYACKQCSGCDGRGYLAVNKGAKVNECLKCNARGWRHDRASSHNREKDERCYACSDCKDCGSKGYKLD